MGEDKTIHAKPSSSSATPFLNRYNYLILMTYFQASVEDGYKAIKVVLQRTQPIREDHVELDEKGITLGRT